MTQFCNFFKNGDIIYNQRNMITGKTSAQFLDISSTFCEVIDHKENVVEIDMIKVKGKSEPETIFGVSSEPVKGDERAALNEYLKSYKAVPE